jgi:phage terminase large subunit-like protein
MSRPSRKGSAKATSIYGERSRRNAAWIERHLRVPEGKLVGSQVKLTPDQVAWLSKIYDTPTSLFILTLPRKNGKTAFLAMILLLHLCGPEAKRNSQLYSAAQSRDQAAILFKLAAKMVRMSPDLAAYVKIRDTIKELECFELGTIYKALSSDAPTAHGLSPALTIHDELGQVRGPRSELYEALETATAAQEDPLSVVISTQAPTDADLLSVLIDDAARGADPTVKLVQYSAPENAAPFEEETIRACNPHFDVFMNRDAVMKMARDAQRMPSAEAAFRNLVLNQRVNPTSPFISRVTYERGDEAIDPQVLGTKQVFVGLDLSSRLDLTALVSVACDGSGIWHVRPDFFAPAVGLEERSRRDRVPYDVWAKQGFLTLTPGETVDYAFVAHRLCEIADECHLAEIAFDRWKISALKKELADLGRELPLVEFGQGFKDMSPAVDVAEGLFVAGKIRHGGNPILKMCAANAVVTKDPAGNRKLDKSKATGRIDGMVALCMALGRAAALIPVQQHKVHMFWVG